MRTETIIDERGFLGLQPEWDAVLSASNQDVPYLRHDWLLQWWRAFGCGELAIVTCRDDATVGRLGGWQVGLGLLPLFARVLEVLLGERTLRRGLGEVDLRPCFGVRGV